MDASKKPAEAQPPDQQNFRAKVAAPVQRTPGAARTMELPYMDLLDHSKRLGRLNRWDWSRPFGAAGLLLCGGAVGALATGSEMADEGVWVTLVVGLVCLACGLFIRRERVESAQDIKADFDQLLSFYEREEDLLQEMRTLHGEDKREAPKGFVATCRSVLKL